jgi:hypothetical protein
MKWSKIILKLVYRHQFFLYFAMENNLLANDPLRQHF